MTSLMHLVIATPASILVDDPAVCAVRASDATGSFGVLPGHADLITVVPDSVVRWRSKDQHTHYCAVRGGVLIVEQGVSVRIACREGLIGDDLEELDNQVREQRAADTDANREETIRQLRLHTQAMRQIMGYLHPVSVNAGERSLGSDFEPRVGD